jgi:hypothetical protein
MESYEGAEVLGLDPGIERAWREGLKPDPLLTVSEWADRYRVFSQRASSEPGRWRTERTPYLREIMDCLAVLGRAARCQSRREESISSSYGAERCIRSRPSCILLSIRTLTHPARRTGESRAWLVAQPQRRYRGKGA